MKTDFSSEDTKKIKGFAILLMLLHHLYLAPERYSGQEVYFTPFSEHLVNSFTLTMKICVAYFVFISAYGITKSLKKANSGNLSRLSSNIINTYVYRRGIKLEAEFLIVFLIAQLYSVLVVGDNRFAYVYGTNIKSIVYFAIDALGLAELFSTPTFLATFWYISLAWIIILVLPVMIVFYKRLGGAALLGISLLIVILFPVTAEHSFAHFPQYILVISSGIICADKDIISNITARQDMPKVFKLLIYLLLFAIVFCLRFLTRGSIIVSVLDMLITIDTCVLFHEFINRCPVIREILSFIGGYATDIFLVHNFIRVVWYYDFTYSFHHWLLIFFVLLSVSIVVSVFIELLKKAIRYEAFVNKLIALYPSV